MKKKKISIQMLTPTVLKVLCFLAVTLLVYMVTVLRLAGTVRSEEFPAAQSDIVSSPDDCSEAKIARSYLPDSIPKVLAAKAKPLESAISLNEEVSLPVTTEPEAAVQADVQPETEMVDVIGDYYRGKMLIVKDPSRVFVGVSGPLGPAYAGKRVENIMKSYGAIAGVNASGFDDPNGCGNGGTPLGLVMSEGKLKYGSAGGRYEIIGFDKNNKLHCGWMTGQQALNLGIRDAVCFGPVLVTNGKKASGLTSYTHGSYNPRTAIGQREDGTVLILMLEGRQISSIGAGVSTVADIMLKHGAVNAANLDGGASTVMYYQDQLLTNCSSLNGTRAVPTAFLVRPES